MDHKLEAKFDSMPSVISAIRCRILTFSSFRSAILFSSVDVCFGVWWEKGFSRVDSNVQEKTA